MRRQLYLIANLKSPLGGLKDIFSLSHVVFHLIQVPVFQGPHELLVAHYCSGAGQLAGQKTRRRWRQQADTAGREGDRTAPSLRGEEEKAGEAARRVRQLAAATVRAGESSLRPPGPAEQVPPGREAVRAFTLPVHSQLGPAPNFLFLFPSLFSGTRPEGRGKQPLCAGAVARPAATGWRRRNGAGLGGPIWEGQKASDAGQLVFQRVSGCCYTQKGAKT